MNTGARYRRPVSQPDETGRLLDRFAAEAGGAVPLTALWAHGSLALGDYQPGRSDLDLIALIETTPAPAQRDDLQRVHQALHDQVPLGRQLHCTYVARGEWAGPGRDHLTWAHGEMFARPVTPVSRRELHLGGLVLLGPGPATVVPPVSDQELADFIRADLRDFWYPHTEQADLWLRDVWVDVGLLTFARATVTLRDGRLITKREALGVLAGLGAPGGLVRDICQRRYENPPPTTDAWRAERGEQARTCLRDGITRLLALASDADR
jgi:hypothetical protein